MSDQNEIKEQLPGDLRRIAEVLDVESALKLEKAFGGTYIYIHKIDALLREIRNKKIREEYSAGKKVRELAIKHRLTERQIWNILGMEPEKATTPSLLDLLQ